MPRADPTPGDLVRTYREGKNWSRKRLGDHMHKSASWVSQVERGEIPLNDLTVIQRLAAVLGAPLQELIEAALGPDAETARNRPYVERLRLAIAGHPAPDSIITPVADGPPCDVESLRQRTLHIWQRIHASAYRDMGPAIAALISDLEHASRTAAKTQRPELLSLLAQTYQAAAAMLVKVGDRGAGWVAADRAIAAAERTHNPALILAGQLRMARTLLDSSEQALARHVLTQATRRHDAIIAGGDHGLISLVGSSALLLAILHARDANTDSAEQCLTVARRLAAVLGADRNHHDTEFGPTNVAMHAVGVAVELGNGQQALDRAAHVRHPEQLPLHKDFYQMPSSSYQWILDSLHPFEYDVASLVPPVFDAYVRIFHPAYTFSDSSREGVPVTWRDVAKANGRVAHPAMEWGSLLGTWNSANYHGKIHDQDPSQGELPATTATELSAILKQFTSATSVLYALWTGHGGVEVKNAEIMELPERPMYVIEGSIDDAANPFGLKRPQSANLWWPSDHKWCVASEVDLLTTYVGGSIDCIQAILDSSELEAMPVKSDQRITWDADSVNPLPDHPLTHHKQL